MSNQRVTITVAKYLLEDTRPLADIAKSYKVSHQTVRLYKRLVPKLAKRALEELKAEGRTPSLITGSSFQAKFSAEEICVIRDSNESSTKVAERMGCSASMIRMIRTGQAYADVVCVPPSLCDDG